MKKSILISIKPEQVAKILNGEKTIDVRTTAPKYEPIEVYIYCTKKRRIGETLIKHAFDGKYRVGNCVGSNDNKPLNGKIVAKFTLSKIERVVSCIAEDWGDDPWEMRYSLRLEESDTAHNDDQFMDEGGFEYLKPIYDYLGFDFPTGYRFGERPDFKEGVVYGYAWRIEDLTIFDDPMKLSQFKYRKEYPSCEKCPHAKDEDDIAVCEKHCRELLTVKRAPGSWCYVEEGE